jgi:hypothetical protein
MSDTELPRKDRKNFKPKRGLGSAVTRQRRKVAEGVRASEDARNQAAKAAARAEIERARNKAKTAPEDGTKRWMDSILNSVIRSQSTLLRTHGLHQPCSASITQGASVVAYTDFSSIVIQWPAREMPRFGAPRADMLNTVARIKGVFQHEMGHLRFTTPWPTILANTENQHNEHNLTKETLHWMWNCLEDQRMEQCVVATVPRIANYLTPLITKLIIGLDDNKTVNAGLETSWYLLAGRQYLSTDVRRLSYNLFDDTCYARGITNGAAKWAAIVRKYIAAKTAQQIYDAVLEACDFAACVQVPVPGGVDDHSRMRSGGEGDPANSAMKQDDDSDELGGDGEGSGSGEGDDKDGKGKSNAKQHYKDRLKEQTDAEKNKKVSTPTSNKWTGGQSNRGGAENPVFTPQALREALIEEAFEADKATHQDYDVQEMAAGAYDVMDTPGLPEYVSSGERMSPSEQASAETIAVGIEQAMETFVTANSPIWQNRVNHGVIDALGFRTKEIGSQDFHRFMEMNNNQGLDVHLSILSDVSYSMQGYMGKLSEFMYAAGVACRNLGIASTFTLWSSGSENYRIWNNGNVTPEVFPAMGGTDPTEALDDLATHNPEGSDRHLVLVFTDGEWAHGFPSLQRWADDGRTIIFIRYGGNTKAVPDMGADRHIMINKLEQLPELLTQSLIDVLSFGN